MSRAMVSVDDDSIVGGVPDYNRYYDKETGTILKLTEYDVKIPASSEFEIMRNSLKYPETRERIPYLGSALKLGVLGMVCNQNIYSMIVFDPRLCLVIKDRSNKILLVIYF